MPKAATTVDGKKVKNTKKKFEKPTDDVVAKPIEFTEEIVEETLPAIIEEAQASDMSAAEQVQVLEKIREIKNRMEQDYFTLASYVKLAFDHKMHLAWGFSTFTEFVEQELEFSMRKAQYLIGVHDYFVNELGDQDVIDKLRGIGWSKAKELKGVVTKENVDEWVEKAQNTNVAGVIEAAREYLNGGDDLDFTDGATAEKKEQPTKVTLNLHPEQHQNYLDAIQRVSEITGSEAANHNIDTIMTDWLAHNAFEEEGRDASMKAIFGKYEELLDVKVFIFDPKDEKFLYGEGDGVRGILVNLKTQEVLAGSDVVEELFEEVEEIIEYEPETTEEVEHKVEGSVE